MCPKQYLCRQVTNLSPCPRWFNILWKSEYLHNHLIPIIEEFSKNYALQTVLNRMGHEVETIDWFYPTYKSWRVRLYRLKRSFLAHLFPHKYPRLRYQLTDEESYIIQRNTQHFISSYIRLTRSTYPASKASMSSQRDFTSITTRCWTSLSTDPPTPTQNHSMPKSRPSVRHWVESLTSNSSCSDCHPFMLSPH